MMGLPVTECVGGGGSERGLCSRFGFRTPESGSGREDGRFHACYTHIP